jgi:hypothetical protein
VNVTGSHVAGGGVGAIVGVILAALDKKVGLHLTDGEAASLSIALAGVGAGVGHAARRLYETGLGPFFGHLLHGKATR